MHQQVLWRVGDRLDTLGRSAQWLIYSLTGFGTFDMTASQLSMQSTSAIAESGRLVFDRALSVPLVATIQQDNRFTIVSAASSGSKIAGKYLMVVTMELERITSPVPTRRWSRTTAPSRKPRKQRRS